MSKRIMNHAIRYLKSSGLTQVKMAAQLKAAGITVKMLKEGFKEANIPPAKSRAFVNEYRFHAKGLEYGFSPQELWIVPSSIKQMISKAEELGHTLAKEFFTYEKVKDFLENLPSDIVEAVRPSYLVSDETKAKDALRRALARAEKLGVKESVLTEPAKAEEQEADQVDEFLAATGLTEEQVLERLAARKKEPAEQAA